MAGTHLPKEEKLAGQNYKIYNPETDGRIYNPARDGAFVYRNTPDTNPIPLQEQINKYAKLKAFQSAIFLVGFLVGFFCLYLGTVVEKHYIKAYIFTWVFLFLGLCSAIATVLLYRGNNKEDIKLLKSFLTVGFLSYSWFDYYSGGFKVVKRRIMEIMSKIKENPTIAPESFSNPVPIV